MKALLAALCLMMIIGGCSGVPLKDGELVIGANTTATLDEAGVARVRNQF